MSKHLKNQSIKKGSIQKHFNGKGKFTSHNIQRDEIIKIIEELLKNKSSTFKTFLNDCIKNGTFPGILKYAYVTQTNVTIELLVPFLISHKYLKN